MSNGNWNLHEDGGEQLLTTTALTKQVPPLSNAEAGRNDDIAA